MIFSLRKKMFCWFLNLNIPSLSENKINDLIKLFSDDIVFVGSIFNVFLGLIIEIIFSFFSSIIISLIFDWRLGLICIGFILIIIANTMFYYYSNSKLKVDNLLTDYFSETVANIKLIKAFNLKENLLKFIITEEKKINTKASVYNNLKHYVGFSLYFILSYGSLACLNLIGGIFIIEDKISTIGSFTGSTSLLFIFFIITSLIWKYLSDFYYIKESMDKLNEIIYSKYEDLNSKPFDIIYAKKNENNFSEKLKNLNEANDEKGAYEQAKIIFNHDLENKNQIEFITKSNIKGKIEFKNVSFTYSKDKNKNKVLNNVSFVINPGMKVGFVGPSGSGKSSIIQLLLRFYEPSEGEILIDDTNIKSIDIKELRDYFSGVFQEPDLFERSIYENIRYGNLNATQEEIVTVALITQIPLALLDENNAQKISQISGGQKQRIAIARCLLKKRNIYFFDEATSALDINTEKKINFNIDNYFTNLEEEKTRLIIAHRLINIQNADIIFVLKDGYIIEQGDHHILFSRNGIYRELWTKEKLQK